MAFNIIKFIDKIKGKKPVKVKKHIRHTEDGVSIVDAYTKFIDVNGEEKEPLSKEEIESAKEQERLDNLEDPEENDTEELLEDEDEDYSDEDIPINEELTKNEKLSLPKISEAEVIPLIEKWQKNKDEAAMYQLLKYYSGIIYFNANKYKTGSIPYNLTVLEAKRLFIKAADKFDTKRGIKFNTVLTNYLKKLYRFVNDNTNIAKIPEQRTRKINAYKKALAQLEDRFGRLPTDFELSEELSWPVKEINRLRSELSRAEILEFHKDFDYGDLGVTSSDLNSTVKLVYIDATPEEKFIMEHTTGAFGKKQLTISELSKKLKLPESKIKSLISNIKKNIIENI